MREVINHISDTIQGGKNPDSAMEGDVKKIGQSQNSAWIFTTLIGGALILNSYLWGWIFEGSIPAGERQVSTLCGMCGALLLSAPLLKSTVKAVIRGHVHIGEMASLAILACFAIGSYQEAGIVAFFLMLAELLESRSALGAREAVEKLVRLSPTEVRVVGDDSEEMNLPVSALHVGSRIRVRPGEKIPADGKIVSGVTTINQANITGESLPADKSLNDAVFAGTVNLTGMIEVQVVKLGNDTTIGKVRDLILQAEATRLPIMRLIDQHMAWYAPAMVMVAAAILYFTGSIQAAISALVVSCPCALVLATPTAMVAGLSAAARMC